MAITKRKPVNYINNKALYTAMIEYKTILDEAVRLGKNKPRIPDYIGQAIMMICKNLAKKGNFSGYTYIDEMRADGEVDCIAAVDNFNPDKSTNPFAYFTQIAWNAFLRRIQKEKKQSYIKHKNFENAFVMNELWDDSESMVVSKTNEHSSEIIRSFEEKLQISKKQNKPKNKGVENFYEDSNEDKLI